MLNNNICLLPFSTISDKLKFGYTSKSCIIWRLLVAIICLFLFINQEIGDFFLFFQS